MLAIYEHWKDVLISSIIKYNPDNRFAGSCLFIILNYNIHFCNIANRSLPWKSLVILSNTILFPFSRIFSFISFRSGGSKKVWHGSISKNRQELGFKITLLSKIIFSINCKPSFPPSNARKSSYLECRYF